MKSENFNNDRFFNTWAIVTGIIQFMDYNLNIRQVDNDTLLEHLQRQDKVLENHSIELQKQTNEYLEKILRQNDEIIKRLDKNNK